MSSMKDRLVSSGRLRVVDFGVSVWECAGWLGRGVFGVLGPCPGLVRALMMSSGIVGLSSLAAAASAPKPAPTGTPFPRRSSSASSVIGRPWAAYAPTIAPADVPAMTSLVLRSEPRFRLQGREHPDLPGDPDFASAAQNQSYSHALNLLDLVFAC